MRVSPASLMRWWSMPSAPATACSQPGCRGIVRIGKCSKCGPVEQHKRKRIENRPNSHQRGYNKRWRRWRALKLARNPICEECEGQGRYRPAEDVHHLDKVSDGNPVLCSMDRLVSLCKACHTRRTVQGE